MIKSFAKINLDLHITGKRSDGYHLLKSHITFLQDVYDGVSLGDGQAGVSFTGTFASNELNKTNNIIQIAEFLASHFGKILDFSIEIEKNIPIGSGLGGSSANAATCAKLICDHWGEDIDEVCPHLTQFGADINACLKSKPCIMSGIGDVFEEMRSDYMIPPYAVLVYPNTPSVTTDVYAQYSGETHEDNDLLPAAVALTPVIADVLRYVPYMSGSGSTCFALCDSEKQADALIAELHINTDWWIKKTRLLQCGD